MRDARLRCALRLAAAVLAAVSACDRTPPRSIGSDASSSDGANSESVEVDTGSVESSSTGDPGPPDACAEACDDFETQIGIAVCHSCRCKAAFDDWLPPVEAMQCANAEPILTYHADLSDTDFELLPVAPSTPYCANPSLLTGSCRPGSRLGQLRHGDVSVNWICRDPYLDPDGSVIYEDMAVIGHNARSGATCFWDDVNDVMHDDDAPSFDLVEATEEDRERFAERFAHSDGSGCVTCHDSDPFIYTPYLQSIDWTSIAGDKGPYHLVALDGVPRSTRAMHLISPQAEPCTGCHRLGSEESCILLLPDALASHKIDTYESEVQAASEPGSPHWSLAYWMPGDSHTISDFDEWEAQFSAARDHILRCCDDPGEDVDGCQWAPVPTEPEARSPD